MTTTTLRVVFSSRAEAIGAREALLATGFAPDALTVSVNLVKDGIAAEAPGQAYEFDPGARRDKAQARDLADVERGGAVLTVSCAGGRHDDNRVLELIEPFKPLSIIPDV